MRELAATALSASNDLMIAQTTVVTTCLAVMIWLGLLSRPGTATRLWTFGFILALLSSYGIITSTAMGIDEVSNPVSLGLLCGLPTLVWSGLRAVKDKRTHAWAGFVQAAVSFAVLWITTNTDIGPTMFRLIFFGASVGAALAAVEALRGPFLGSRFGMPLVAASAAFVLVGVIGIVGNINAVDASSGIVFVRGVLLVSMVYVICATVSLLFLVNRRPGARDVLEALDAMSPINLMRAVVRERLLRAIARQEENWSFVDLRLDDTVDLREAAGELGYSAMVSSFEDIIVRAFPADADLGRVAPGHVLVFVSRSPGVVREVVRAVLNRTSAVATTQISSFHLSASAGIATVDTAVDTFDSLSASAGEAADAAQLQGGDRWRRAESVRDAATERAPR